MIRHRKTLAGVIAVAAAVSSVQATDIYWKGGNGPLNSVNYYKSAAAPNIAPPTTGDFADVGLGSTVTVGTGDAVTIARLRIGHNFTAGQTPDYSGPATLNMTDGTLTLAGTVPDTGHSDGQGGGLVVGFSNSGTLNVSGGTLSVSRFITIGLDDTADTTTNAAGATASLKVSGTGIVSIAYSNPAAPIASAVLIGNGVPASVTVQDSGTLRGTLATTANGGFTGVELRIGVNSPSTYTQTGGTTSFTGDIALGMNSVAGTTMAVSGGTVSTARGMTVGAATGANTTNTSLTLSGNSSTSIGSAFTVGAGTSSNTSFTISGNASLSVGTNGSNNIFVGRGTSTNTTFNMTGGTVSASKFFLMGTATAAAGGTYPTATGIVGNQSGGTLTTGDNFVLADSGGASTYNLSGTGSIVCGGRVIVGREFASAIMNQTAGSVSTAFASASATRRWSTRRRSRRGRIT